MEVARNHRTRVCSQFALSRNSPAQTVSNISMAAWQHAKERDQEKVQLKSFSGACISMDRRCDQFPNCKDFSDEESIILVLGNYF